MLVQQSTAVSLDGHPCVVPDAIRFPQAARLANSYWCPLGPAAGRAWVLLLGEHLANIRDANQTFHTLRFRTRRPGEPDDEATFASLLFVKSQRLTPGEKENPAALHLVELADKRLLVEQFSDTGNLQFNVRSYAQGTAYLQETAGYTWSTAAEAIWNTMAGVLGSYPGLPDGYAPDGVPENMRFIGVGAWRALHQFLLKIGCTVAYDPHATQFRIVRLGGDQTDLPETIAGGEKLLDAETLETGSAKFPATIRVYFHSHHRSHGQERDTEPADNWSYSGGGAFLDVLTGAPAAQPGTVLALWDDLPYLLDENNAPSNASELAARALARATDWLNDQAVSGRRMHRVFPRMVTSVRPGSQIKAVLWRAWGPEAGGTATEIVSHPGFPSRVTGGSSLADGLAWDAATYSGENFAPPDLARRTYPAFPRLPNIVQIDDSSAQAGQVVSPNADNLFPARLRRWVAGSLATLGDCWVRFVDEHDAASGNVKVKNKDAFLARLSGIETSGGQQLPIYLARRGDHGRPRWGKVQSFPQAGAAGSDCWTVAVRECDDCQGANPSAPDRTIVLAGRAGFAAHLGIGDVIAFCEAENGELVCVSDTSGVVFWGKATADSTDGQNGCPTVTVNPVEDCSGANPTQDAVTVVLPPRAGFRHNVKQGDVIGYTVAFSDQFVCVTDYGEGNGKTRVHEDDPLDYLDAQFEDHDEQAPFNGDQDPVVQVTTVTTEGNARLRLFLDISAIDGFDESKQQVLAHAADGGLAWIDVATCS
jgi:hypothetical protein